MSTDDKFDCGINATPEQLREWADILLRAADGEGVIEERVTFDSGAGWGKAAAGILAFGDGDFEYRLRPHVRCLATDRGIFRFEGERMVARVFWNEREGEIETDVGDDCGTYSACRDGNEWFRATPFPSSEWPEREAALRARWEPKACPWCHGNQEVRCGSEHPMILGQFCTREPGHDGDHVNCRSGRHNFSRWTPAPVLDADGRPVEVGAWYLPYPAATEGAQLLSLEGGTCIFSGVHQMDSSTIHRIPPRPDISSLRAPDGRRVRLTGRIVDASAHDGLWVSAQGVILDGPRSLLSSAAPEYGPRRWGAEAYDEYTPVEMDGGEHGVECSTGLYQRGFKSADDARLFADALNVRDRKGGE